MNQTTTLQDPSTTQTTRVSIIGASGFTGGELLRLLLQHPNCEVVAATSQQHAGTPLHRIHPNLRGATQLRFTERSNIPESDIILLCTPHGRAAQQVPQLLATGTRIIDLSADHRLRDPDAYATWYGHDHPHPENLTLATYGLPEANRSNILGAQLVSGVGCLATAMNLALLPLAQAGILQNARVIVDGKIGSSAAGITIHEAGMHHARSRSLRLYAPTSHRHAAEVQQQCGITPEVSVHATELVRGILATCHILLDDEAPDETTLWRTYRAQYNHEPFVRIVKERQGLHRGPDPKLVAGSNYADIGFHSAGTRIVATCALDNLVKGAAGTAIQCLNLMTGQPETTGLTQLPVYPQ